MEIGGYMRKSEVVHKQVEGYLIPYNLQLAFVRKLEVVQTMSGKGGYIWKL